MGVPIPAASTDLEVLKTFVLGAGRHGACPSALDDGLLHSLAKDLRSFERALNRDAYAQPCMTGPIAFLLWVMVKAEDRSEPDFRLSRGALGQAVCVLQIALEREIVSRILDVRNPDDDLAFTEALSAVRTQQL